MGSAAAEDVSLTDEEVCTDVFYVGEPGREVKLQVLHGVKGQPSAVPGSPPEETPSEVFRLTFTAPEPWGPTTLTQYLFTRNDFPVLSFYIVQLGWLRNHEKVALTQRLDTLKQKHFPG